MRTYKGRAKRNLMKNAKYSVSYPTAANHIGREIEKGLIECVTYDVIGGVTISSCIYKFKLPRKLKKLLNAVKYRIFVTKMMGYTT